MVKFVSQPFLTNGSGFIHQKQFFYKIKKSIFRPNYVRYKKMLKIKSCGLRLNNARYERKLRSKIVHLKEFYSFYLDHFVIKRTVFVLIVKNVIKNKKFNYPDKLCDI